MTQHDGHKKRYRREDDRLIRGAGRYADDVRVPGQAIGVFVRSPYAFATITGIDLDAARAAPGVVGVFTAADMAEAGIGIISGAPPLEGVNGSALYATPRPALAGDIVRHLGDPVALVVAETLGAATDAAELVAVDYEPREAVTGAVDALEPGAPQVWPDAPNNLAVEFRAGSSPDAVDAAFAGAARVVQARMVNHRVSGVPMEPRAATAEYDPASDRYTMHVGSQGAGVLRGYMLPELSVGPDKLRILTEDVGGAFGLKTPSYPEYAALLVAAKHLGRPVHWNATRSEAFVTDNQARDVVADIELALDADGKFLALRVSQVVNMGAYLSVNAATIACTSFMRCLPGMYDIPLIDMRTRCAFTNTVPTGPYRGAGRPEANYTLERIVEKAARETGIDPVDLRRRNLITPGQMPYKTAIGTEFDRGEFPAILEEALRLADHAGFAERRRRSEARGKHRGVGVACFLEHSGANPNESANMLFHDDDTLEVQLGPNSSGQGHHAIFADVVGGRLGIDPEKVIVREGDSDFNLKGYAAVGSRTAMTAGAAVVKTIEMILEKAKPLAASMLEAAEADLAYRDGHFEVVGTDRKVGLFAVAREARQRVDAGRLTDTLDTTGFKQTPHTFPNGCHIAEVEVDPETGGVTLLNYSAVDDCGNVLDHDIVEGQVIGGVVQSFGQVFMERIVYDAESGQLLTGSFMDYGMPRAGDVPNMVAASHAVPSTTNPLGVKGVGEAGTTAGLGAITIAVANALPDGRGIAFQLPATPDRVWRVCQGLAVE